MSRAATIKTVRVVSADCGDLSEIGAPTELFPSNRATVSVADSISGYRFTLYFPSVFLNPDMPVLDASGERIATWTSANFCGDRGLFGYTDIATSSDLFRVTYTHLGKVISWQLVE